VSSNPPSSNTVKSERRQMKLCSTKDIQIYNQKNIPLLTMSALQSMFSLFYLCYRTAYFNIIKNRIRSRNALKSGPVRKI
jgi:hypothetical protein